MGCFSSSEQSSTSSSYTPAQQKWQGKALDLYGGQLGKNDNVYQGDRVAGFTPLQTSVFSATPNFVQAFNNPASFGTPLMDETGRAIGGLLAGQTGAEKITDQQRDDYFQRSTYDPTMRMLKEDLLPTVDEAYAGGNFFGSARGKARDKVTTDVANTLVQQKAGLDWNVLQGNQALDEAKAGRTQQAVNQGMQYSRLPAQQAMDLVATAAAKVEGLGQLLGIGSAQQTQEQREIQAKMAKFAEENQITDPDNLAILMSLLGMNYSYSKGSSDGAGLGYVLTGNFLGGVGKTAGGNLGSQMFA